MMKSYKPEEFVLKKYIVARVMDSNILSWSFWDDRIHMKKNRNERNNVMTTVAKMIAENM